MYAALILLSGCGAEPVLPAPEEPLPCPAFGEPLSLGNVPSPPAEELSGIAVTADGRILVHNDSESVTRIHVLDALGQPLGAFTLAGVEGIDVEDLAIGPSRLGEQTVWLGDIGDNLARREVVSVYRFALPEADEATVEPERLDIIWPDGPRDAETLFVDELGSLWLVDKQPSQPTGVYQVREPRPGPNIPLKLTELDFGSPPLGQTTLVTGGDLGPAGLVLRTYLTEAYVWPVDERGVLAALAQDPCPVELAGEFQGEAIGWSPDGLLTVAEGPRPDLNFVPFAESGP